MLAGLQSADLPPVSRGEVTAAIAKNSLAGVVDTPDVQKAQDLLALRKTQPASEGTWGRAAFEAMKAERKGQSWDEKVGMKDVDLMKDPQIKTKVETKIKDIAVLNGVMDILQQETPAKMATRMGELVANGLVPPGKPINLLLNECAVMLAKDPFISDMFGFPNTATEAKKAVYFESFILNDTEKREVLQRGLRMQMTEIHKQVLSLPTQPATDKQEAQLQLEKASKLKTAAYDQCKTIIESMMGGTHLNVVQETRLRVALTTGDETQRNDRLKELTTEFAGVPQVNAENAAKVVTNEQQIIALEEANKTGITKAQKDRNDKAIKRIRDENKKLTYHQVPPGPANTVDPAYATVYIPKFKEAGRLVDSLQFSTARASYYDQNKNELTFKLQVTGASGADVSVERQAAEDTVLENLNSVFGGAMAEVIDKEVQKLREGRQIENKQKEDKAEDQLKLDLINMHKEQDKHWIEGLPGQNKDKVHLKNLEDDMKMIAYRGDEGTKAQMARFAGLISNPEYTQLVTGAKTFEELTREKTIVDSTFKTRLDALCTKENIKSHRDKLMVDYHTAERYMKEGVLGHAIRWGRGIEIEGDFNDRRHFKMTESQWDRLYKNFEGDMTAAFEKSDAARDFIKQLEAQGIIGTSKLKTLMYILMLILGVGGVGAGVAMGGVPGIAVAGALNTAAIGGAALNKGFNKSGPIL